MAMRDLIPWRAQENATPALFRDPERGPLVRFRREMDRLFNDLFRAPVFQGRAPVSTGPGWQSLEMKEKDGQLTITAELPGFIAKDVELTVHDGVLALRGQKKREHQGRARGWSRRSYGRFERSIALPEVAEASGSGPEFRDGLLTIRMPGSLEAGRGRRIPIGTCATHP